MLIILLFLAASLAFASDSIPLSPGVWTSIGPSSAVNGATGYVEITSGRVTSVAPDPGDANTIYAGTAGGGVWRTSDGGATWTPLTDTQPSLFIGAVAVAPSNHKIIYAGTGEANNGPSKETRERRYNIYSGRGVLKSTDGGATWTVLGVAQFTRRSISRIAVSSSDPNTVYVAVGPRASDGLDGNTGVWKSADGGTTWANTTTKISTSAPATDLLIDPSNPSILYAAFGEPAGNAANGVYKSIDGGANWAALNLGATQSRYGRIALSIYAKSPQTLFASMTQASVTSNSLYGVFKSVNGGSSWTRLPLSVNDKFCPEFNSVNNILAVAGDYHQAIAIDPSNASNVYLAGLCLIGSTDGGNTWNLLSDGESSGPHRDHHALAFDAAGLLIDGNDGGLWRLDDPENLVFTNLNSGLQTTQFQGLALHPTDPNVVVGGTQDNGTMVFNDSLEWSRTLRGDGGVSIIDPTRPARVYQVIEEGADLFSRSLDGGNDFTLGRAILPAGDDEAHVWYFPMIADPTNGSRLFVGASNVWASTDAGVTWKAITAANQNGWTQTAPITALALAASNPQVVYAAAGGHILATANSGTANPSWTGRDLPDVQSVSAIVVNPADANSLCAARDIYASGLVFCSKDGGKTWSAATGDLPQAPVLSLAVDWRTSPATLYAGTLAGVYSSANGGAHWQVFATGLPNTAVPVLVLQNNVLAAATHGRGVWETLVGGGKPQISTGGIVVHAGVSPLLSPGSLADVYGSNLAAAATSASLGSLSTTLGGAQILVNGTAAPLIYVSPQQSIFQVPSETALGTASVVAVSNGASSAPAPVTVQLAAPSILTYGSNRAVVQLPDGSVNSPANPSKVGSVAVAYLIGSGPVDHPVPSGALTPDSPLAQETLKTTVTVGTATATVFFAGLTPRFPGLMQVNFAVPDLPPGDYAIQITIGSFASNQALLAVAK